jgi:hypothetical protein
MSERFKHECDEWDGLMIDENDLEFAVCSCFDDPEAIKASELQSKFLNDLRDNAVGERATNDAGEIR